MLRPLMAGILGTVLLLLAACGGGITPTASDGEEPGSGPAAGICERGTPDCIDTVVVDDGEDPADEGDWGANFDSDQARQDAQTLIGAAEADLPETVRIGRYGAEQMMLTEDYVLGRMTAELDEDADGTYRVVSVTVELPDGPETFTG